MADPFLKFYPTDWRSDPLLRICSLGARGLWIELIGLMHEADPYGHLLIAARAPTDAQLSVLAGTTPDEFSQLMGELESAGVFSRTSKGVIYSRRMTRDAKKAAISRKNGKKGGNPSLGKERGNKPWVKGYDKGGDKTHIPYSIFQREESSSSSSAQARAPDPPDKNIPITSLPDDAWALYQSVVKAVGVREDAMPTYWMPPAAVIHVQRWLGMGLSEQEIIDTARFTRPNFKDPPTGPKALDGAMSRTAVAKQMPPLKAPDPSQTRMIGGPSAAKPNPESQQQRRAEIIRAAARGTT